MKCKKNVSLFGRSCFYYALLCFTGFILAFGVFSL